MKKLDDYYEPVKLSSFAIDKEEDKVPQDQSMQNEDLDVEYEYYSTSIVTWKLLYTYFIQITKLNSKLVKTMENSILERLSYGNFEHTLHDPRKILRESQRRGQPEVLVPYEDYQIYARMALELELKRQALSKNQLFDLEEH